VPPATEREEDSAALFLICQRQREKGRPSLLNEADLKVSDLSWQEGKEKKAHSLHFRDGGGKRGTLCIQGPKESTSKSVAFEKDKRGGKKKKEGLQFFQFLRKEKEKE